MKSKILITGSQGFIGKILVNEFKNSNKLILIDKKKNSSKQKNFYKINLLNLDNLEEIFRKNKIETIIHLASEIFDDDKNVYHLNVSTSKNLILMAKKYKIKNFIFTSTFSIFEKNYSKPILENETPSAKNAYGKSKYKVETILKKSKLKNYTILRVPIVVGKSRSHRMGILFEMIRNNFPLFLIGDGNNKIQFIQVDDLCLIIKKCLSLKKSNTFNVGTKKSFTFKENLSYIIEKSKSNSKIFNVNYYFGNLALNILIFFKLIDLNFYHKALLTENIVLNTKKIFDKLRLDSNKSSKDILLENYNYYVKNLKKINNIKSGSDKKPSLKIFNIFKIFSKFF
tara:strand:+ start:1662 stop:2684 length:1023 start_codon:yes stop_codon:yes gene_type:complete